MIRYLSTVRKEALEGKVVLLRLDFNTEDDWRMRASLGTIKFLLSRCRAVIIMSHKGRPNGFEAKLSLRKDASRLGRLLGKKVGFLDEFDFFHIKQRLDASAKGAVFVLENMRFLCEEAENSAQLGRALAQLGDIYVNDAFAVSHRKNASVVAVTHYAPSFAGLGMEAEIKNLSHVMRNPKRPLVMIFGGAKVGDKLEIMERFKNKADAFLLGGALANTLLALKGVNVGASKVEADVPGIKSILSYHNLILPVDFKKKGDTILDIGPATIGLFKAHIKEAGTVVWNGPVGLIEDPKFREGTKQIAKAIAANKRCFSVIGGGETVMAIKRFKIDKKMSFVSTGGGAMLEYLSGRELPGIEALRQTE